MTIAAGIDVGSAAAKAVVMKVDGERTTLLAHGLQRIRKRDVADVVNEVFVEVRAASGVKSIDYIATTGEGEDTPYATGHFYGMTTHARGAMFLEPRARAVLDVGALHARAVSMDERGRVLGNKMTSQCASGSGQFLENISRYLGVALPEVGPLSLEAKKPEKISSICAVLAETDVINMVSRGIATADILRGIHDSMAGRFAHLLRGLNVTGVVFVSGGLAQDMGMIAAIRDELAKDAAKRGTSVELVTHPLSAWAGAIGAAIWGGIRHHRVGGTAWTATEMG